MSASRYAVDTDANLHIALAQPDDDDVFATCAVTVCANAYTCIRTHERAQTSNDAVPLLYTVEHQVQDCSTPEFDPCEYGACMFDKDDIGAWYALVHKPKSMRQVEVCARVPARPWFEHRNR